MSYLGLAFFGEGRTDRRFLIPLLSRLSDEVARSIGFVGDISDIFPCEEPTPRSTALDYRILHVARDLATGFHVLFVHQDGGRDRDEALRLRVQPGVARVRAADLSIEIVPVVPVRMMETWALADGEALGRVLGTTRDLHALGLPPVSDVEGVQDPKALLADVIREVVGRRRSPPNYLDRLGEEVNLCELRRLPSFVETEALVRETFGRLCRS